MSVFRSLLLALLVVGFGVLPMLQAIASPCAHGDAPAVVLPDASPAGHGGHAGHDGHAERAEAEPSSLAMLGGPCDCGCDCPMPGCIGGGAALPAARGTAALTVTASSAVVVESPLRLRAAHDHALIRPPSAA